MVDFFHKTLAVVHILQQITESKRPCKKIWELSLCEIEGHGRRLHLHGSVENLVRSKIMCLLASALHFRHEGTGVLHFDSILAAILCIACSFDLQQHITRYRQDPESTFLSCMSW
jgi:hypothetical protein